MTRSPIQLSVFFALITLALAQAAVAQQLEVTPFMKSAMDELGKTAGWRIEILGAKPTQQGITHTRQRRINVSENSRLQMAPRLQRTSRSLASMFR